MFMSSKFKKAQQPTDRTTKAQRQRLKNVTEKIPAFSIFSQDIKMPRKLQIITQKNLVSLKYEEKPG